MPKSRPKPEPKFTPLDHPSFQYITDTLTGGSDRVLSDLQSETAAMGEISQMQIGADQGVFMTLLTRAIGARSALEIGTFTGYSSICLARGLPDDGRLLCLDASAEWTAIARRYWKRAKLDDKIELRLGPAAETLKRLAPSRMFDIVFIDADKTGYDAYYELALPRVRPGGIILFDNMLWGGRLGRGPIKNPDGRAIDRLNKKLGRDSRVDSVLLSIGDGLRVCRVRGS